MGTSNYSIEFKRDAVYQITVRGGIRFERFHGVRSSAHILCTNGLRCLRSWVRSPTWIMKLGTVGRSVNWLGSPRSATTKNRASLLSAIGPRTIDERVLRARVPMK